MKKLTYAFALLLLAGVVREIKIHEQTNVKAQGIQPDRKNYVSRTMPVPFTLESALTLTSDAGAILKERELYAVKKNGDILRRLDRYRPPSAIPYSTLSRLGNASTHGVTYF